MTEKELRKHIKPYLRYAIKVLNSNPQSRYYWHLCNLARRYAEKYKGNKREEIDKYLIDRIWACMPSDSKAVRDSFLNEVWWQHKIGYDNPLFKKKRLEWLKWQLKNVKP